MSVGAHHTPAATGEDGVLADLEAAFDGVVASVSPSRSSAAHVRRIAGRVLLGIGICSLLFLVFELEFTGVLEQRSQSTLLTEFKQRVATRTYDALDAPIPHGPVALLDIPRVGVHQVVVQGSGPTDLQQGPGHLAGSPLPGEYGNAVILGHQRTYGAPFADLSRLTPGAEIDAVTGQGKFSYRVTRVTVVKPGQDSLTGPVLGSRLTLVTSTSASSPDRLVVVSRLVGKPLGIPRRPPVTTAPDALGTQGDRVGLLEAVLWAQVLVVAVILAGRAYRVWPRRISYLLTTPPILLIVLLMFEALDRFLPGTL